METWGDKTRRLEAHGSDFKLGPALRINALRMLMTGHAKEYFDILQVYRDTTDGSTSTEELLSKVKDYARRKK